MFPNIHKEPSGTDVLAWARYLLGGSNNQQGQGQSSGCTNPPEPLAAQCQGGVWQSVKSKDCIVGWKCTQSRILSFAATDEQIASGKSTNIGWFTEGMRSCVVSSPDLPDFTDANKTYTNVSGAVPTPPLAADTRFVLSCITNAGLAYPPDEVMIDVL